MNKSRLIPAIVVSVCMAFPATAQVYVAEGTGISEDDAKNDADWKLEFQIEVAVNSVSAFSDIVEERGKSMKYDPASDMVIQPTTSLGLAGLAYKAGPRKGFPDPFKLATVLDPAKLATFYPQGLEKVRQEILAMAEDLKADADLDTRQADLEDLMDFIREYGNFRNLAILLGMDVPLVSMDKVLAMSSALALDNLRTAADTPIRLGRQIAGLVDSGPVWIEFSRELKSEKAFPLKSLADAVVQALKTSRLKLANSLQESAMVLYVSSVNRKPDVDRPDRSSREIHVKAVSRKGSTAGLIVKAGVFSLVP